MKAFNRILCTAITAAMFVSNAGAMLVYASGDTKSVQSTSADYEQVLIKIKSKITIPENLTEFDTNTIQMSDGSTRYNFEWHTKDDGGYSYSDISVSADENGNITDYHYYDNEHYQNERTISDLSNAEIKAEIEKQLTAIIPEKYDKLKEKNDISASGYDYSIQYDRIENGLKVRNNYVSVNAVVYDGNVIIQNISSNWDDVEFTLPENVLTYEQAAQIYRDKAQFYLNYGTSYKTKNEYTAFLRYNFRDNVFIDAVSGEILEEDKHVILGARNTAAIKEASSEDSIAMGAILTKEELTEIDKLSGLISYEEAENKIRAIKELGISSDMKVSETSIMKNGEIYIMQLVFANDKKHSYISINAQNGDLYSASNYSYDDYEKAEISDSQKKTAEKKITAFVEKYIPEYYKSTMPTKADSSDRNVLMRFERVVNDIPLSSDGISVTWDAVSDKFVSVHTSVSNVVSFPSAENIIDEIVAYEKVLNNAGFEKMYMMHDKKMIVVYGIVEEEKTSIDAFSGEMIDSRGKVIDTFSAYSDISGHWAEKIINTLADYNIKKSGEEFKPDECITQKEFLSILYSAKYSYSQNDEESLYQQFIMEGVLNEADINPDSTITKQQAIVYLLKSMGHGDIAEIKGIFKCDFADISAINEEYLGYIAIAKGLGIVNGDESNNFNPGKNITNAEAAVIIYNYLKK